MQVSRWPRWQQRCGTQGERGGGLRGTGCPGAEAVSRPGIGHSWMAGGAAEGPATPRRERGWWEHVSSDLSSAGRKEGRKWGRLELHRRFLPVVYYRQARAGLAPASSPSHPSACRVAMGVPHGDRDVSAVQPDLLAAAGGTTIPRSGASRSPSETGIGQGTQAVHCAGGLAGGLKITCCECLEGLGPRPWPHTIGGNAPASSIVWLQTLASSVLPRGHGSRQHKGAAGCQGGLLGRW